MNEAIFLEQFKTQFVDADDIMLTLSSPFREVGSFDSLTGMAIIVMIQDEYGVEVSEKEFKSCATPGEVLVLVTTKIG